MISIYPSIISEEPLEIHKADKGISLYRWLCENVTGFATHTDEHPISVFIADEQIPAEQWTKIDASKQDISIYIQPKGAVVPWVIGAIFSAIVTKLLAPKVKIPSQVDRQSGRSISTVETMSNGVRFGEPIPDVAGSPRRYPDYLNQPRKRFGDDNRTQTQTMLMCVGRGSHQISANDVYIGETRLASLSVIDADIRIYQPGEVVDHPAAVNWYNIPEVGSSSTGSSGLPLAGAQDVTTVLNASSLDLSNLSIGINGGQVPEDWQADMLLEIVIRRQVTATTELMLGQNIVSGWVAGWFQDDSEELSGTTENFRTTEWATVIGGQTYTMEVVSGESDRRRVQFRLLDGSIIYISGNASADGYSITAPLKATEMRVYYTRGDNMGELAIYREINITKLVGQFADLGLSINDQIQVSSTALSGEYIVNTITDTELTLKNPDLTLVTEPSSGTYQISIDRLGALYQIISKTQTSLIVQKMFANAVDVDWLGFIPQRTHSFTVRLSGSNASGGWLGPYSLTPSGISTDHIEWDVLAPQGLGFVEDNGSVRSVTRTIEFQWSIDGGETWHSRHHTITGSTSDQLGFTFTEHFLWSGEPPTTLLGRFRRIGPVDTRVQAMDQLQLYGVKSNLGSKNTYPGVTVLALEIAGSDVLSAQTENKIWVNATRVLPTRTGGTWGVAAPTRNIVDFLAYIAHDIGYTDDQIDMAELDRLHEVWSARGDFFDHVFDGGTVRDAMNLVLQAGFAELTIHRGKIRPVRDEPRSVYDHPYTRENMTSPLRTRVKMIGRDEHDGVDVEYINRNTWTKEVVECRLLGDQGFKVKKINLLGVTDRTRAWRIGMRERRAQRYIRWDYSFKTEMDALNSKYLDYVPLIDNVPGYGYAGIIKSLTSISSSQCSVIISEPFPFETGENHIFAWRKADGSLSGPYPVTAGTSPDTVTVNMTTAQRPTLDPTKEPTHYLIGTTERFCFPALIKMINPNNLTDVTVEAENYDARKYADDDNTPPN